MSHFTAEPNYRVIAKGRHYHAGILAALLTVFIWVSWLLSVKMGAKSTLTMFDLSIMRYGVPAIIFSYFTFKARKQIQKVPLRVLIGICCGMGVPFFYFASQGMARAPVAHAGLLIAGTLPLFVTFIAVFVYKETLSPQRLLGLIAVTIGIVVLFAASFFSLKIDVLIGDFYFLASCVCFSVFTICLRVSGLPPLAAAGLLGLVSSTALLLLISTDVIDSGLHDVFWKNDTLINDNVVSSRGISHSISFPFIALQFCIQALMVGLITGFSYGCAIQRIGAETTAAIGALTPVLAALSAHFFLGEALFFTDIIAMLLIFVGVLFASEIKVSFFTRQRSLPNP